MDFKVEGQCPRAGGAERLGPGQVSGLGLTPSQRGRMAWPAHPSTRHPAGGTQPSQALCLWEGGRWAVPSRSDPGRASGAGSTGWAHGPPPPHVQRNPDCLHGDAGLAFPETPQVAPSGPCRLPAPGGLREEQGQGWPVPSGRAGTRTSVPWTPARASAHFPTAHCALNACESQASCVPGTVLGAGDTTVRKATGPPVLAASSGWVRRTASQRGAA